MKPRLNYRAIAPAAYKAMLGLETYLEHCGLDHSLKNLVVLRASQLNHCAFCIDMHTKDLRAMGETEQRIYLLDAWREAPFYSPRERAALAWAESVTLLSPDFVPDEVYEQARKEFSEEELVNLTFAITAINGWNRLSIAFRNVPGSYQPAPMKIRSPEPESTVA
jgi:AhpD family alkylhydroperoxidase